MGRLTEPAAHLSRLIVVQNKYVIVPVALAVLAVGAAGCGNQTASTAPRAHRPVVLHLAAAGASTAAMAAAGRPFRGPGGYVLRGELPAGRPGDQPVWRFSRATSTDAGTVAAALGLDGTATRVAGGWVLRTGADRLAVRDDGSWSLGLDCGAGQPVSAERLNVMCATASGGSATGPDGDVDSAAPAPSAPPAAGSATARAIVARLVDRLGIDTGRVTVTPGTPTTSVQASYDVDGHSVSGMVLTVQLDRTGRVTAADGWLAHVTRADTYPLITAQQAFHLLLQQPRPMIESCMRRPDGKPGCAPIPPTVVTGASLALMLTSDRGRPVLAPAWLFDVAGTADTVAQVAVDPRYLARPTTPVVQPPPAGRPVVSPAGASPA